MMNTVVTAKQMREVDAYMINQMHIPGILLMENAALGVCQRIMQQVEPCTVHVFCGTGNNGGDGLAVARILLSHGYDVYVVLAGSSEHMTEDTAVNFKMFTRMRERVLCTKNYDDIKEADWPSPCVVVDALLGTGLSRDVEGFYHAIIHHMNQIDALKIAVDIPSGIHADTGQKMGIATGADYTVTFQYPKPGHYLFPGKEYTGELDIIRIGVDDGSPVLRDSQLSVYETKTKDLALVQRKKDTHKGDYGRLLVVAGSDGMAGAAVLCTRAASRAGTGLITLGSTDEVVRTMHYSTPEAMSRVLSNEEGQLDRRSVFDIGRVAKDMTAMAIGPGLGMGMAIQEVVEHLIKNYDLIKVLDADAINVLAGSQQQVLLERAGEIILTPHPKEFARLLDSDVQAVLDDPIHHASRYAQHYEVTLVLKGTTTIIAGADGRVSLVSGGSPGMAKGGSGDVLTGVIGGFAAQGMSAYESALYGVYIAAAAGEIAAEDKGEYSMTPVDTLERIGKAIESNSVVQRPVILRRSQERYQMKRDHQPEIVEPAEIDPAMLEKTAEQALAEIEEKEKTQEIQKEIQEAAAQPENKPDKPTRRRIG